MLSIKNIIDLLTVLFIIINMVAFASLLNDKWIYIRSKPKPDKKSDILKTENWETDPAGTSSIYWVCTSISISLILRIVRVIFS